jgi:hypothetical protein
MDSSPKEFALDFAGPAAVLMMQQHGPSFRWQVCPRQVGPGDCEVKSMIFINYTTPILNSGIIWNNSKS